MKRMPAATTHRASVRDHASESLVRGKPEDRLLLELLTRLEAIGERDKSLFDTVVREAMGDPIFYGFIKPQPGYVLPDDYEMPDEENRLIKEALGSYIPEAVALAASLGIDSFHGRLAAFQNEDVRTERKKHYYDSFFGWMNPDLFDEGGDLKPGR